MGAWTEQLLLEMHNTASSVPSEIAVPAESQGQGHESDGNGRRSDEVEGEVEAGCLVEEAFARLQLHHQPESREGDGQGGR